MRQTAESDNDERVSIEDEDDLTDSGTFSVTNNGFRSRNQMIVVNRKNSLDVIFVKFSFFSHNFYVNITFH